MSAVCFFYGTPPMALYVTLTLLAGGHLDAVAPAPDASLVAGDVRVAAGARMGMHRAFISFRSFIVRTLSGSNPSQRERDP